MPEEEIIEHTFLVLKAGIKNRNYRILDLDVVNYFVSNMEDNMLPVYLDTDVENYPFPDSYPFLDGLANKEIGLTLKKLVDEEGRLFITVGFLNTEKFKNENLEEYSLIPTIFSAVRNQVYENVELLCFAICKKEDSPYYSEDGKTLIV